MAEQGHRQDDPVESLESIEMTMEDEEVIMVSGYDDDGNFWKEFYRHDESVLVDKNNEEEEENEE